MKIVRYAAALFSVACTLALLFASAWPPVTRAQAHIDFGREVQPLLKERCYECHGPTKQMNGYRLDRRGRALAGVVRPNIIPGNSDSSRLIRRVLGPEFGTQMPPDDPLSVDEINILWAQLSSMTSDAYATGAALAALHEAGIRTNVAAYRRGVQFLLRTQLTDGSWFVQTRSHPTQIYFESGFPHGASQFISAAATNWAMQALILSAREPVSVTAPVSAPGRTPRR